jgi:hypothetical protein
MESSARAQTPRSILSSHTERSNGRNLKEILRRVNPAYETTSRHSSRLSNLYDRPKIEQKINNSSSQSRSRSRDVSRRKLLMIHTDSRLTLANQLGNFSP